MSDIEESDKDITSSKRFSYDAIDRIETKAKNLQGVRSTSWVDSKGLCNTCSKAVIMRRAAKNERIIRCTALGERVAEDLIECSLYHTITELDLSQMGQMAIAINVYRDVNEGYL